MDLSGFEPSKYSTSKSLLECLGLGYRLQKDDRVISHLLLASIKLQLTALLKVTDIFRNSIKMECGVDKCT